MASSCAVPEDRGRARLAQAPQGTFAHAAARRVSGAQQRFTGHPVSLEFESADLRTVLRTFADISGLNIVIDQSVQGAVDVSLNDVPWDQALDIILRDHKLGYSVDGTIVRIAPITVLASEEAKRRKLADEQALSGELQVLTRPLSYAKAAELTALLTRRRCRRAATSRSIRARTPSSSATSPAGSRVPRSSSTRSTSRSRRWRSKRASSRRPATSRASSACSGGSTAGSRRTLATPRASRFRIRAAWAAGRAVTGHEARSGVHGDQPRHIGTASSAIGLALGSVNGAFNLDLALSALEQSGNGRILSTPRVATQNNVPAEITQGVQIPIQTVANNTVTVTFRDAALKLNVTPQITAANTVIMQLSLENSSPDFSRAITGIPPINTQRARDVPAGQRTGRHRSSAASTSTPAIRRNDRTPGLTRFPFWAGSSSGVADRRKPRAVDFHHAAHHQDLVMGKGEEWI